MNEGLLKDIDWAYIGAKLAHENDVNQAAFFAAFLKECRSWGTAMQVERQLASINALLSAEDVTALTMLSYTKGART